MPPHNSSQVILVIPVIVIVVVEAVLQHALGSVDAGQRLTRQLRRDRLKLQSIFPLVCGKRS